MPLLVVTSIFSRRALSARLQGTLCFIFERVLLLAVTSDIPTNSECVWLQRRISWIVWALYRQNRQTLICNTINGVLNLKLCALARGCSTGNVTAVWSLW